MTNSLPPAPTYALPQMKQNCDHSADCLKMIQLLLDGEATDQQVERFKNNLETCRPCIEMYHLEKEIRQLLQGRMEKRCCPDTLVQSIKARLVSFS
jgi:mycothiol system anti-sigma-R factor